MGALLGGTDDDTPTGAEGDAVAELERLYPLDDPSGSLGGE
jgi:hypothetical protein